LHTGYILPYKSIYLKVAVRICAGPYLFFFCFFFAAGGKIVLPASVAVRCSATNSPLSLFEYCTCGKVTFFIHGTCVPIPKAGSFSSLLAIGYRFCSYFLVHFALVTKPRRPKRREEKKDRDIGNNGSHWRGPEQRKKEIKPLSTTRAIPEKKRISEKAECAGCRRKAPRQKTFGPRTDPPQATLEKLTDTAREREP
jgi:hypothetical protein